MVILWVMLAYLVLYLVRVILGPSIWDRLLGLSLISTKVLLIAVLYASYYDTAYILDIALVGALLGFIGIIFTALFLMGRMKGGK
ncbi:MAG: monovalent cation/H+ antiporter complex subunit F [Spirochaetes bacterium]|nr:monovalent cation/H+ antiporter complex subunit F [Spirochaetota bacterium]